MIALALAAALLSGCGDRTERAMAAADKAQALLDAGDLPGARAAINEAMRLREDQLPIILLDARIKLQMRDIVAAYEAYNVAVAIDPNNKEALTSVALLGVNSGNDARAVEAADRLLLSDPENVDAKLIKGIAAINGRKFDEALALGDSILKSDPRNERGLVLRGRSLFLLGEREKALAELTAARKMLPDSGFVRTALMECARDMGDGNLVLEQLGALRTADPKSVDLAIDDVNIRYKMKDLDGARAAGMRIIADHSDDSDALDRLSSLWRTYDKSPLTIAQLDELGADGPYKARMMVARFYLDQGDLIRAAKPVSALGDQDGRALMSRVAFASGDAASEGAAEAILKVDKTNCDALAVRTEAMLRRQVPQLAVIEAQKIAMECPDRDDGFLLLARAYQMLKRDVGTRRAFEQGITARPLEVSMTAAYARWLVAAGKPDSAVSVARALTNRAAAKPSAWLLLQEMCDRAGNSQCHADAAEGERQSWRNLAIDLPQGERRINPLLGGSLR